jgi:hypothetical protein
MTEPVHIELARENEAVDLLRFVSELGLTATRAGTVVEVRQDREKIGDAVTAWLSEWQSPLVPSTTPAGAIGLRPPAD